VYFLADFCAVLLDLGAVRVGGSPGFTEPSKSPVWLRHEHHVEIRIKMLKSVTKFVKKTLVNDA